MQRRVLTLATVAAMAVAGGSLTACGGDRKPTGAAAPAPSASRSPAPVDIMTEARNSVTNIYKGSYRQPDATTRIAARDRKIAIISKGQSSPSSQIPTDAAEEAARSLGWDVVRFDLKLDPRSAPQAVREAIAAGVNGIISNVDCAYAPAEFAAARAAGIKIVPLFTFDCTDPIVTGSPGQPTFTTFVAYGPPGSKVDYKRYNMGGGVLAANAIITATGGKAKVIAATDVTSTILNYTHAGFKAQLEKCKTCQLLEEIKYTPIELANGSLVTRVRDALKRHPEVTALRGGNSAAIQLAIAPMVVEARIQAKVIVVGGEGQDRDLDLIRTRQGLNITLSVDSPWNGWATVDAMNSAFNGEDPRSPGIGAILVDKDHNLPPSGSVQHNVNFKNVFRKAWGVG